MKNLSKGLLGFLLITALSTLSHQAQGIIKDNNDGTYVKDGWCNEDGTETFMVCVYSPCGVFPANSNAYYECHLEELIFEIEPDCWLEGGKSGLCEELSD